MTLNHLVLVRIQVRQPPEVPVLRGYHLPGMAVNQVTMWAALRIAGLAETGTAHRTFLAGKVPLSASGRPKVCTFPIIR